MNTAMKTVALLFAMLSLCASGARAEAPGPITTLSAIAALSNGDADRALPVAFQATVTYFRGYELTLFVQDAGKGIYVRAATNLELVPGDRILVRGMTYSDFRPDVISDNITLLGHGPLPKPLPVTYPQLIQTKADCMYVVLRGVVRSADVELSAGRRVTQLELAIQGGYVGVTMDSGDPARLNGWLDSEVEITGVVAGRFDGKMQQTGILLHATSYRNVKILRPATQDPWSIPVTPMDQVLRTYNVEDHTRRVRVEGVITYYHQAQMAVLQNGSRSIRVLTPEIDPLEVGDHAEAIGIPFVDNGFLTLKLGAIRSLGAALPVAPVSVSWNELAASNHAFDLISIEGDLVTQVREQAQDVYIISSQGHLFSAALRHPFVYEWGVVKPPPPMPAIAPGSRVKVTGVAILDDGNPFNGAMGFGVLLRTAGDVAVMARPSWMSIRNLTRIVMLLLMAILIVGTWGWMLQRKVHRQTAALAKRIEVEAIVERRRGRILEDINGGQPLVEILEQISELVSFSLDGASCCCQVTDGASVGSCPPEAQNLRIVRRGILARTGPPHGTILAGVDPQAPAFANASSALAMGAGLATLAIETSRLYSDLVHRSEFDLLTDVQNRFALEKTLCAQILAARQSAGIFGLIYIDLNEFKQVNDQFGHQVGDLYLQEVTRRMKRLLRPGDVLGRLGGDEFAVVVSEVRNRAAVEEIAARLQCCFEQTFEGEGYSLHGSASFGVAVYPEDANSADSLLRAADAAMYVAKYTRTGKGITLES